MNQINKSMPRVLVYVAGPFSPTAAQKARRQSQPILQDVYDKAFSRAAVEENIAHAGALALEVAKLGAFPMCPHLNTSLPEFEDVQPYQFWIDGTEEMLLACHVAVFTDNYEQSSGARGEMATCKAHNIPAFKSIAELKAFLEEDGCETFLGALKIARILDVFRGSSVPDTIPAPPLPSVSSAPPSPGQPEDFGVLPVEHTPRSGALKL